MRKASPTDTEILAWKVLLKSTDLVSISHERNGSLTSESLAKVLSFSPSVVPALLVAPLIEATVLSSKEANKIERDSQLLWGSSGPIPSREVHPGLEKVANALGLWEKAGIRTWDHLDDMDVHDYQVLMHSLNCYSTLMALSEQQRRLRARAIQESGIGKYTGR